MFPWQVYAASAEQWLTLAHRSKMSLPPRPIRGRHECGSCGALPPAAASRCEIWAASGSSKNSMSGSGGSGGDGNWLTGGAGLRFESFFLQFFVSIDISHKNMYRPESYDNLAKCLPG